MTTDIEKQFFDTFGIEPKYRDYRVKNGKIYDNKNPENRNIRLCYPQITDRILLKLICVINRFDIYFDYYYQEEYQVLREIILEDSINLNCKLKQTDFSKLKKQIQALFKEG